MKHLQNELKMHLIIDLSFSLTQILLLLPHLKLLMQI